MIGNKNDIIWWETQLTDHQSYTLEELSKKINLNVIVVKNDNKKRLEQGWKLNSTLNYYKLPKWNILTLLKIIFKNKNKINVFAGPFENKKLIFASLICVILKSKVYFLSEPYSNISSDYLSNGNKFFNYIKFKLRPYIYNIYGKIYMNKINGIFAISNLAINQYIAMGANKNKIFPFGYFVPKINYKKNHNNTKDFLNVIFVGSLIYRKGIDYLCKVVNKINSNNIKLKLDIYGPGNIEIIGDKIKGLQYCGIIPFGHTQKVISKYDLSIFPSRYDGWGVVMNESILAEVPVLSSDSMGAKCIVEKFGCGDIFSLSKKNDLEKKIINLINNPEKLNKMKNKTLSAQKYLTPEFAANYIFNVINKGKNIDPPWYKKIK